MTAALYCNLSREAASRFSILMAIPIILASALLKSVELITRDGAPVEWLTLLYAIVLSGAVAYSCIHYFLRLIERIGFMPFVIYRILLGSVLLLFYFA